MTTETFDQYIALLNRLRAQRRETDWKATDDRDLLINADALFEMLSDAEQTEARSLSWLAWPDHYDQKVPATEYVENDPDTMTPNTPPRMKRAGLGE